MERVLAKDPAYDYHLIEVMACPGGSVLMRAFVFHRNALLLQAVLEEAVSQSGTRWTTRHVLFVVRCCISTVVCFRS